MPPPSGSASLSSSARAGTGTHTRLKGRAWRIVHKPNTRILPLPWPEPWQSRWACMKPRLGSKAIWNFDHEILWVTIGNRHILKLDQARILFYRYLTRLKGQQNWPCIALSSPWQPLSPTRRTLGRILIFKMRKSIIILFLWWQSFIFKGLCHFFATDLPMPNSFRSSDNLTNVHLLSINQDFCTHVHTGSYCWGASMRFL